MPVIWRRTVADEAAMLAAAALCNADEIGIYFHRVDLNQDMQLTGVSPSSFKLVTHGYDNGIADVCAHFPLHRDNITDDLAILQAAVLDAANWGCEAYLQPGRYALFGGLSFAVPVAITGNGLWGTGGGSGSYPELSIKALCNAGITTHERCHLSGFGITGNYLARVGISHLNGARSFFEDVYTTETISNGIELREEAAHNMNFLRLAGCHVSDTGSAYMAGVPGGSQWDVASVYGCPITDWGPMRMDSTPDLISPTEATATFVGAVPNFTPTVPQLVDLYAAPLDVGHAVLAYVGGAWYSRIIYEILGPTSFKWDGKDLGALAGVPFGLLVGDGFWSSGNDSNIWRMDSCHAANIACSAFGMAAGYNGALITCGGMACGWRHFRSGHRASISGNVNISPYAGDGAEAGDLGYSVEIADNTTSTYLEGVLARGSRKSPGRSGTGGRLIAGVYNNMV